MDAFREARETCFPDTLRREDDRKEIELLIDMLRGFGVGSTGDGLFKFSAVSLFRSLMN